MRPDDPSPTEPDVAKRTRRLGAVAVIALLVLAAGAFALLRQRMPPAAERTADQGEHRSAAGHGMNMHGRHRATAVPVVTPLVSSVEADAKALRDLKESREQVERMKAQGFGRDESGRPR